jgi:hypothetical protein
VEALARSQHDADRLHESFSTLGQLLFGEEFRAGDFLVEAFLAEDLFVPVGVHA